MKNLERLAQAYRVDHGKHFRLKDFDPAHTGSISSKQEAAEGLDAGVKKLQELQDKLYAQDRWAVLLIFQGMDAAGKDGAIKHVMSGVNPQSCQVHAFKEPSREELNHDYLWRAMAHLPERGHIGIFNRSYYEEVLVVRVHPELLKNENIPASLVKKDLWKKRFTDICACERYLADNGVAICKFFLHLSREEQKKRFLARLENPEKYWKFSTADIHERGFWDKYAEAYEEAIRNTAKAHAPWYVVPADHKWFARLVVAAVVVHTLEQLQLAYPKLNAARRKEVRQARKLLENQ